LTFKDYDRGWIEGQNWGFLKFKKGGDDFAKKLIVTPGGWLIVNP
jgi:hypothetical protein